jgi:cell division protein FtsB
MSRNRPFIIQFVIVGGFIVFLYIFFALATSIYKDYQLEKNIGSFQDEISNLDALAKQKPKDVSFYQSEEFKDKYAKESLNLLNPGEKVIIIPTDDQVVKSETATDRFEQEDILKLPNRNQWWEYFFGRTLSLEAPSLPSATPAPQTTNNNQDDKQVKS